MMSSPIPEPHAGYAREICELVANHGASVRERITGGLSTFYATRLVEDPAIICVAGERGSGKTTVLATAAAELVAQGHVVIPPVRPEHFAVPGAVLPTVVAHLQSVVHADWIEAQNNTAPDVSLKVTAALDRTLRQANLFSFGASDSSSLRADEQAADRSLAASADSDFLDTWRHLTADIRDLATARKKSAQAPLLVIPVDDPDLAPGMLRQILLDLRLMTSVDGVVGIACLDLDEAKWVLSDAYASSYHTPPNRLLAARVVEAQIAKAFPEDRRVNIVGLDANQRLAFTALDLPLPSIQKLCEAHSAGGTFAGDTIASVLRMPDKTRPSPYATALPSNPRDLRGLAYRLAHVSQDSPFSDGEAAMALCQMAIATGLKQSGATDPTLWPGGLPFEVLPSTGGSPRCTLRFDNIAVHTTAGAARTMPGAEHDDSMTVTLAAEDSVETQLVIRGDSQRTVQRLDPSFSYAVLLIREFSHYYDLIECGISGPIPIRGGNRASASLRVWLDGTEADNRFLNCPAWEAYYDYFALDDGLSTLIPIATEPIDLTDRRLAIEAYVIDYCRNVISVQQKRRIPRNPAKVSLGVRAGSDADAQALLDQELKRLFKEIATCLTAQERLPLDHVRARDFVRWVESGLPNVCHERLLRPEFIDKVFELRGKLLHQRHRLATANAELCGVLEHRVKSALDEAWVRQLIPLVQRLDDERGQVLLASHLAALDTVARGRTRLLGDIALSSSERTGVAEPTTEQQTDYEVALATLDRLEAEASAIARGTGFLT